MNFCFYQKFIVHLKDQVHDELLIEAKLSEADQVEQILREEMQQAADLQVPLEIDLHRGNNWYEAK